MVQNQALAGLKVVGFTLAGVGPIVLKSLALHGATVVIVESEKRPDIQRMISPFKDNKPGLNRSYRFQFVNSDKYGMTLDLKHPRAKEVSSRLIKWADVMVENFRPGAIEKLGLGYKEVSRINPQIVMISLSLAGQTGPQSKLAGYGPHLAGYCGFLSLVGWPDRTPVSLDALTDSISPRFGVTSILAALEYRNRTGKGLYIDLSQFETCIQFISPAILDYTVNGRVQSRNGNRSLTSVPHGVYRCKGNDSWCAIEVSSKEEWEAFRTVIGDPEWSKEIRFSTFDNRKKHEDELNQLIEEWTINYEADYIQQIMQRSGIAAGRVRTMGEAVTGCPQLKHRHFFWEVEHPEMGKTKLDGLSYVLSKTPYKIQRPAPCIGQDTEFVCTKLLGMSDEEYIQLELENVLK